MSNANATTVLQKAITEIGLEGVTKAITHAGMSLGFCDVHGHYVFTKTACCPICPPANGTTATEVEHYINVDPLQNLGTNPQQKMNPLGI